jgi:small-conductance mechanosensitive channel
MRHRLLAAFVHPCLLLVACLASPAAAQMPGLAPAAVAKAAAPPAAPALSPAETKQMIDLLNDPQKRAAFTATLETLAKASAVAGPKTAAPAAPLAPDSVAAQALREGSTWLAGMSGQLTSFGRVLGDLPSVWAFSLRAIRNPDLRARVLDAAWRLSLVLAAAGLAEWGAAWLLRRPVRAIARRVPEATESGVGEANGAGAPPPDTGLETAADRREAARVDAAVRSAEGGLTDPAQDVAPATAAEIASAPVSGVPEDEREAATVEHVLRRRRFARTIRTLKRLPFVLLCFVLDLLPLALFLGIGYAGTLVATPAIQAVLQVAFLAYAVCRVAISVTRMFTAPDLPSLRLVHVSDAGAHYTVVWVRRIFAIGAVGFALSQIGAQFGLPAPANDAFLKAVFLVVHVCLIVIVLQCRASVARLIRSHKANPGLGGQLRNRLASVWHLVAIFYIAGLWMVWAAEVRHGYLRIWHIFLVGVGVLVVARLISIIVLGGLDRAFRVSPETRLRHPGLEQRADRYYPLLRKTVSTVLVTATGLALLQAWGINTVAWFRTNALGGRLVSASLTILVAGAVALAMWEVANASMDSHLARLTQQVQVMKAARLRTLLPILRTLLLAVLVAVFGLTALSEVGVNIAPLLAGAGILGVAIGFGSQKLVQDFITGIFLLVENAMQVGDWVTVAGLSGSVENLSIRTMRLRAGDGSVHIIPFSSVSTVTNVNRGIGNAAVSVTVPMEEDSDRVCDVLSGIARQMRGEDRFSEFMRSDLQLWGVDKVDGGVVTVLGQIVCTDAGRWAVQREFNRRLAIRFKEEGLRIATPVQTVYNHIARDDRALKAGPATRTQDVRDAPSGQLDVSPPPAALGNTN